MNSGKTIINQSFSDWKKIYEVLSKVDNIVKSDNAVLPSLCLGNLGKIIYWAVRYKQTCKSEYYDLCISDLEGIINNFESLKIDFTLGNGVAGVCWTIKFLIKLEILTKDDWSLVENILPYLEESVRMDIKEKNYDLLYGYIGKALAIYEDDQLLAITDVIRNLDMIKNEDHNGIYWGDVDDNDKINFGNAHGIPSISLFLIKMYESNKSIDKSLIYKSIEWLISKVKKDGISSFPHYSHESNYESRLGWCFGDLGIVFLILKAGKLFNNYRWLKIGKEIFQKAAKRNIENSGVYYVDKHQFYDTGFCHGTAGIVYLFSQLCSQYDDDELINVRNYWLKQHIDNLNIHLNCYHLMKKPDYSETSDDSYYSQKIGLLEGVIGSSLVLVSQMNKDLIKWSEIFLLN